MCQEALAEERQSYLVKSPEEYQLITGLKYNAGEPNLSESAGGL